jgi:amino acid adenylation domain-containing protein
MPARPALHVDGQTLTYGSLLERALCIAATIQQRAEPMTTPLAAVFADRSGTGFAGILGGLLAGRGYVPLNPNFPIVRTRRMLQRAGCTALVVDATALPQLDAVLVEEPSLLVLLPAGADTRNLASRWPQHVFVCEDEREPAGRWVQPDTSPQDVAYLLFTSGSTGEPKGVPVTHANVAHFLNAMIERYGIMPGDRFSQMFDTTFDLSVFDMFVAWSCGACVFCPSRPTLLNPDRFIRDHQLTTWFAVPSVGLLMLRFGALKTGRYPSLRRSLFCGEPLPVSLVEAWQAAAPTSLIENLYGPTELTVACAAYRWDPLRSPAESGDGIVPIGAPFANMRAKVVDEAGRDVAPGGIGELLMCGPQRTRGYWRDEIATARAHVSPAGERDTFYRTGDRVRKPADDGPFTYVGRTDHQIKVLGHRVELGEVESALRAEPGVDAAVAVGWPVTNVGAGGIAAFVTGRGLDLTSLHASIRGKLQEYAVPQTIAVVPDFPRNTSGKVDRQALIRLLEA